MPNDAQHTDGAEEVTKDSPLFKIEHTPGSKFVLLFALIAVAIVVTLYVFGILFQNSLLTVFTFVLAIIFGVFIFAVNHKLKSSGEQLTEQEIDAKVEAFRTDIIDTFIGYDLPYTEDDIKEATDKYRLSLVNEKENATSVDPNDVSSIMKSMMSDRKNSKKKRKESKALMKEQKKIEKQEKKDRKE